MYLPKFEKAISKDKLRPSLMHVAIFPDYTTATDTHAMVWGKIDWDRKFQNFIDENRAVFVKGEQWKKISNKDVGFVDVDKHALVFIDLKKGGKISVEYRTKETADFRYPDWQSVLPVSLSGGKDPMQPEHADNIGFNPKFAANLAGVWKPFKPSGFKMQFFGKSRPILTTMHNGGIETPYCEHGAIIMPQRIE